MRSEFVHLPSRAAEITPRNCALFWTLAALTVAAGVGAWRSRCRRFVLSSPIATAFFAAQRSCDAAYLENVAFA
jgi:hypothetical protein